MEQQSVIHNTFVIERNYPVAPERVFEAFADPVKKRRWFVDGGGNQVEHYEMDFRVGGQEHARFGHSGPVQGMVFTNEASFQDIVPNRRIVLASKMAVGDKCISASLLTVEFLPSEAGTNLILTHQGAFFEGADGPEMRAAGWRKLLERLTEASTR
jgi:uncharacterized protein YndB with AHSA1/START domain